MAERARTARGSALARDADEPAVEHAPEAAPDLLSLSRAVGNRAFAAMVGSGRQPGLLQRCHDKGTGAPTAPPPPAMKLPPSKPGAKGPPRNLFVEMMEKTEGGSEHALAANTKGSLAEEVAALNTEVRFNGNGVIPSVAKLVEIKSVLNEVATQPSPNYAQLRDKVQHALRYGLLGLHAPTADDEQAYAAQVKEALLASDADLGGANFRGVDLARATLTFKDCEDWGGAVGQSPKTAKPRQLADILLRERGWGRLPSGFPGERVEAKPEAAGSERTAVMLAFGEHVVAQLRTIAVMDRGAAAGVKPELTGSLVLKPGGYAGTPADLDINVTLPGNETVRGTAWAHVRRVVSVLESATVDAGARSVDVRALTPIRALTETKGLQRRYRYTPDGSGASGPIVAIDVEVKDVSGGEWRDHLKGDAQARETTASGRSQAKWIMLDTLRRTIQFREEGRKHLGEDVDRKQLEQELVQGANDKLLWEKLGTSADMAMIEEPDDMILSRWIRGQVVEGQVDDYVALYFTVIGRNRKSFDDWLKRF